MATAYFFQLVCVIQWDQKITIAMVTLENASASLQQSVVIIAISVLELTLGSPTVKVTHFLNENYLKSQTNLACPVS